jgi:hypothetical protein
MWAAHPRATQAWPRMFLGIHVSMQASGVWIVRVPCFTFSNGRACVPNWRLDQIFRVIGPLPLGGTRTIQAAEGFGEETARLFLTQMAPHYLQAVADGTDPTVP